MVNLISPGERMALIRCPECERIVDTDYEEGGIVDEWVCDNCYERHLMNGDVEDE